MTSIKTVKKNVIEKSDIVIEGVLMYDKSEIVHFFCFRFVIRCSVLFLSMSEREGHFCECVERIRMY